MVAEPIIMPRKMQFRRSMATVIAILVGILTILPAGAVADEKESPKSTTRPIWRQVGRIDPNVIREVSGVVASRKHPGVLWVHSDSGNPPKLVAINSNGAILAEVMVAGAPNIDWEDIAIDDAGRLYLGDIGNNTGMLPVRYIYALDEPDPHNPPQAPVPPTQRWRVRYADEKRVNCEGLFWHAGTMYTVSRGGASPGVLYRLAPQGDDELIMQPLATIMHGVSGADVSSDGKTLLLCTAHSARMFAVTDSEAFVNLDDRRGITFPDNGAVEACCFDGDEVVLIPENGRVYRVPEAHFSERAAYRPRQRGEKLPD